jgi:uncharacterized phage protein gp47/JayE
MTSTYEQLIAARSQIDIAADLLNRIEARGILSKGWTDADVRRGLIEVIADIRESEEYKRIEVIDSGFLRTAKGALLDLLGVGFFDEERLPATIATLQFELSDSVGQGPYIVPANAIAVIGADTDDPLYYRLQTTVTVPQNGSVSGAFVAVAAGSKYNALANTPVKLATPIPGVEIAATFVVALSGIVVDAGTDSESDDSYQQRCSDKWSTIAAGWTQGAIRFYIRQVVPDATRISVRDDGPTTGEAWAYCATPTGPILTADALAAAAYLNDPVRKPVSNRPVRVLPAVPVVVALAITLYTDGSATALSLAAARLAASTRDYTDRIFPASRIYDALYDPATGVYDVQFTPSDNVELAAHEVLVLQPTYSVELFG